MSHQRLGRYRILRPLGEGGMGRIFLGEAAGPGGFARRVVVKRVKDELDPGLRQALTDEARLVASLVHRNLVPVLDLEEHGGERLVVLEHVDGMDLRRLLQRRTTLPWPLAVFVASEVAAGLDYAHRKTDAAGRPLAIVHRDVSPANILLSWEGEVKLTDFGVAAFQRPGGVGGAVSGGNFGYMAPEQARSQPVDARADLFALGVVLYEALTGGNPIAPGDDARRVPRLAADFPAPLVEAVARLTAPEPAARFASAAALREALLEIPGQPKDPAQALAALLAEARPSPQLGADALYEAVLGGAGPLTVRPTPAPSPTATQAPPFAPRRRARALVAAALALGVAASALALLVALRRPAQLSPPPPVSPPSLSSPPSPVSPTVSPPTPPSTPIAAPSPAAPSARESPAPKPAARAPVERRARKGALSINAIPWANIFLDDRALGHTPRQNLPVDAGRHRLRLVTAAGDVRTRTVEIAPGQETRVSIDFARP